MGLLSILLVIIACGMVWSSPRLQRRRLRAARLGYLRPKPHVPEGFQQILVPTSLAKGFLAMIRGKAAHEYLNELNGHDAHFLHQAVCAAFDHGIITAAQRKTLLQVNRAANIAKHSSLCKQKKVTLVLDELVKRDSTDNAGGGAIDLVHVHGFCHGAASCELSLDCAFGGEDTEDESFVVASSAFGGSGGNPSSSSDEAKERISGCGSKISASCGIAIEAEETLHSEVLTFEEEAKQEHDAVISSFLGLLSHGAFGDRASQKDHTEDVIEDSLLSGSVVHEDEFLHDDRRTLFNDNTVENNQDFVHEVEDEKKALAEESAKSMLLASSHVHEDGVAGNCAGFEALSEDSDSLLAGSDLCDDGTLHDDRRQVFTDFTVENNLDNDNTVENNRDFVHEMDDEKKALAEESANNMMFTGSDVHEDGEAGNLLLAGSNVLEDGEAGNFAASKALSEDSDSLLVGSDVHDDGTLHDDRRHVFTDFTVANNLGLGHEVDDEMKALSEVSAFGLLPAGSAVHANDDTISLAGFGVLPEDTRYAGATIRMIEKPANFLSSLTDAAPHGEDGNGDMVIEKPANLLSSPPDAVKLSQQCMWTDICSSDDGSDSADGVHDYSDFSLHDGDRDSLHAPFDQSVRWHLVGGVWTKAAGQLQQVQKDRWNSYGEVSASWEAESSISPRDVDSGVHDGKEDLELSMPTDLHEVVDVPSQAQGFVYRMIEKGAYLECVSAGTLQAIVQHSLALLYRNASLTCRVREQERSHSLEFEEWADGFRSSYATQLSQLKLEHSQEVDNVQRRVAWDFQWYTYSDYMDWYGEAGDEYWQDADPSFRLDMLANLCRYVDEQKEIEAQLDEQLATLQAKNQNLQLLNDKLVRKLSDSAHGQLGAFQVQDEGDCFIEDDEQDILHETSDTDFSNFDLLHDFSHMQQHMKLYCCEHEAHHSMEEGKGSEKNTKSELTGCSKRSSELNSFYDHRSVAPRVCCPDQGIVGGSANADATVDGVDVHG